MAVAARGPDRACRRLARHGTGRGEPAEETGFTAGRLEHLGHLNRASGMPAQRTHVLLATDLTPGEPMREITEQDMRQRWFSRSEFERMVREGVITGSPDAGRVPVVHHAELALHQPV